MKIVEEREGFQISENRQLLWKHEIEMIEWLGKVCDKYEIQYFLIGGSEIGAVRHKGFIPWDDDIDLGMLRVDFERFLQVFENELPGYYELQYKIIGDSDVWSNLCRIRDKRTTGIIDNQIGKKIAHGAFIEIYPYDNLPESNRMQKRLAKRVNRLIQIIQDRIGQKPVVGFRMKIWKQIYNCKSIVEIDSLIDATCKMYMGENTRYVGTLMSPQYVLSGNEVLLRSDLEKTIKVPFENTKVHIPQGFDRCLRKQYGNYMALPPVDQRGTHHSSKVFYDPSKPYTQYQEKDIKDLFEKYGYLL